LLQSIDGHYYCQTHRNYDGHQPGKIILAQAIAASSETAVQVEYIACVRRVREVFIEQSLRT
jgi:hypothetical protein